MVDGLDLLKELPAAPNPTSGELARFNDRSDWTELFFNWQNTIAELAVIFSFLVQESPAVRRMNKLHYIILTALLNRCGRLMAANLRLASEDRHAEAITIVNRSIHETAIKLIWLCVSNKHDKYQRYLADGMRNDLEFQNYIEKEIESRGYKMAIEKRMLNSIRRSIKTSGLSEKTILDTPKLPDLASMMTEVGFKNLMYIVVQRMGSHDVHGTWTGLLSENVDFENSRLSLRPEFNAPKANQFVFTCLVVIEAISSFCKCVLDEHYFKDIVRIIDGYRNDIVKHNETMAQKDVSPQD